MASRLRPLLANLALLGFSLVVALAGVELVLRLVPGLLSEEARLRLSWQQQRLSHTARTRPDSAIGFLYVPGGHAEVTQGEVRFSYTTDADGFRNADPRPDRAEVVAVDSAAMVEEGKRLAAIHPNIVVKVPVTEQGLRACRALRQQGIRVNVTLCFQPSQALLAAKAGATYISPFIGRLDDVSEDGMELIHQIR